jgi:hypothetical protein
MWIDYFNGCARARSLDITTQIKIMGEPLLVFTCLWIGIYFELHLEKYKIMSWKKKAFEDLKDLLVSFRIYFVIIKNNSCISTVYTIYCYKYM